MKIICLLKGFWYSIINLLPISGHEYIEIYDNKDIQILQCEVCNHISASFKK